MPYQNCSHHADDVTLTPRYIWMSLTAPVLWKDVSSMYGQRFGELAGVPWMGLNRAAGSNLIRT